MQKGIRLNDGHVASLGLLARKDGTRKGYLSKRSSDNTKWQTKWFALLQNLLFYFESDSSSRPSGLYLLEGCVCDRAPSPKPALSAKEPLEKQHYFTVNFSHENQKALELRTEDAKDCDEWVAAIAHASYRTLATEHEALMQKYLHLLQIVETEKTVATQLRRQIEDGEVEIERLKAEIATLLRDNERIQSTQTVTPNDEDSDIKKIKKVQSFLRGWLCRRKWKTIIQDYIRSPHADSMRKRNQVVFSMLEAEAEYVQQLHILVNNFLRPLRMAASSKKPPITHDDVSSIFLNSETIMFLHQIFYQGLKARISSWPTLVLADLFDILLPMLNIYQEFVRNHQYSLQILAHCKQNRDFDKLLKHYEAKPDCEERTLETFLTYPMFQIPRYILTLHELLAHTPHEHVERNSLDYAKSKLEELSRVMHDEVSETENIRKNLAIERMIIEGCEILLDTSQTFVRQGSLIQVPMSEKGKITRGRLGSLSLKKEGERQCFLFSKHLIICTRGSGGKLHLTKNGVISLIDCTLLEDPESTEEEAKGSSQDIDHLDFKIGVEPKDSPPFTVILVASSRQEKAAWTSDISQCVDNIRCNGLMMNAFEENSKVTVPQMIKTLTQDDPGDNQVTLEEITQMAEGVKAEPFENHSALEIAEQLTLLDHLVFKKIPYEEFFGQGWMKLEKNERTPYIMKTTKHFNDISNLIASEIIRNEDINARVSAIEKWVAVADICRCLHNYNAVLEITSSMNRSAIFRLKKTWLKVSKQTKALIDKLQKLVSSEGRFKNLREALKNCDPPCVPYLGMYLTDLAFIEEGTPNYTEDGLVNFSKMRMISHIIREIRQFQQTAYKIEHQVKVTQYLLDQSFVMDEESLYESSLRMEPKLPT
ncbi:ras-specific guanine nucleotide-releasing factor 1 [Lynx canadensis]|uniref:ras-specific guanine nucleotide-releasing factor 1 n=1 Tax=Lynx canadensis TaxID=61383 RepID=UPI0011AFF5DF|nr:ras-specific guanine nucleotide-releasing factor 1 [Lynx canadensis]